MKKGCIYGFTARYEKSVAFNNIKAAIDERYGRYAVQFSANAPVTVWRIDSEGFVIQLAALDKRDEEQNIGEAGTTEVIYLPFPAKSACETP